jgi:hypothetical protein
MGIDSTSDKALALINSINAMGGVPAECKDELASLKQDARDLNQARLARESAIKNQVAGYGSEVGAGVVGTICIAGATTIVVGAGCLVGAGVGILFGWFWGSGSDDAREAAEDEMEDVLNTMENHVNALCNCIKSHVQ